MVKVELIILNGVRPPATLTVETEKATSPALEEATKKLGLDGYVTKHHYWGWCFVPSNNENHQRPKGRP